MTVVPCTLKQANELVKKLHRHHKPVHAHRFAIALWDGEKLCGVCSISRPVAQESPQYQIAEVVRLATDGTPNSCSKLLGAAARICKEMGFMSIQTFILESESGKSLKASGWTFLHKTDGGSRDCESRPRKNENYPTGPKLKFEKRLK